MKKIRRGAHMSVRALEKDIRDWIATWNENPRPYVWVKTADQILASLARYCERVVSAVEPPPRRRSDYVAHFRFRTLVRDKLVNSLV